MDLLMLFFLILLSFFAQAKTVRFGERLCHQEDYACLEIKRGDSWVRLFPEAKEREWIKRINRMNIFLEPGMILAIPKVKPKVLNPSSFSPLPIQINSRGEKVIWVSLSLLAFGAYAADGHLLRWGPISPGEIKCPELIDGCKTPLGSFRILRKGGEDCTSNHFPRRINGEFGGSEMPFCMFFYRGYALHGSRELPGYADSYGCIRLLVEDAKWLNIEFIGAPGTTRGTKVVIVA